MLRERRRILTGFDADADEDVGLVATAEPVVELRHHTTADRLAELTESSRALGNRHRKNRLASFTELCALGDEPQPIEIHVRATDARDQALVSRLVVFDEPLEPGNGKRPRGLHHRPVVIEHIFDGGADLVCSSPERPRRRLLELSQT